MKVVRALLVLLLILATFAALLWWGWQRRAHDAEAESAAKEEAHEAGVVKLDAATQKRIGLAVSPLRATQHQPARAAYGRVIDPSPLAALDAELATAEAALDASRAAEERARGLFQGGENVARKTLETAESQLRTDETRLQGLRRKLELEWGAAAAALDAAARGRLIDALVRGETELIRVDVAAGQALSEMPKRAQVTVIGRESEPFEAQQVVPATLVDPKTQTQGFLLTVEHPPFPLHPGTAVTAWLQMPGEAKAGVVVPRSAIVYFGGAAWIYLQAEEEEFTRTRIPLDEPMPDGVFVGEGFKGDEQVVVTGGQILLAEEQKASAPSEE